MNNLNAFPAEPKLIEAVILACLEKKPDRLPESR